MFDTQNPLSNYVAHLLGSNVTANTHSFGVNKTALFAVTSEYRILGTSLDMSGKEYIAIIENVKYPIYGVQFHPEKVMFEWNQLYNDYLPRTYGAIVANTFFGQFFINEVRKGPGHLTSDDQKWVDKHVIYNFYPVCTGCENESENYFVQVYTFNSTL